MRTSFIVSVCAAVVLGAVTGALLCQFSGRRGGGMDLVPTVVLSEYLHYGDSVSVRHIQGTVTDEVVFGRRAPGAAEEYGYMMSALASTRIVTKWVPPIEGDGVYIVGTSRDGLPVEIRIRADNDDVQIISNGQTIGSGRSAIDIYAFLRLIVTEPAGSGTPGAETVSDRSGVVDGDGAGVEERMRADEQVTRSD